MIDHISKVDFSISYQCAGLSSHDQIASHRMNLQLLTVGNPGHVDFGYSRSSLECSMYTPFLCILYPSYYLLNSIELLAPHRYFQH
jgi:hypothetical protein